MSRDNRNFFVGTNGLLVHDFSFVQPVLEPFDREPDLATLVAEGHLGRQSLIEVPFMPAEDPGIGSFSAG